MIHSGSRNLGKQVGDYYNKLAASLNEKWYSVVSPEIHMPFLPQGYQGVWCVLERDEVLR